MLVLSRQRDQSVMIGDDIEVRIIDVRGDKARLGFVAPREVAVHRKEVYDQIREENRAAARLMPQDLAGLELAAPKPTMRLAAEHSAAADQFLLAALEEARAGVAEEGLPFGAVLVRGGRIIARGRDGRRQTGDPTAQCELHCLRTAGRQAGYRDTELYATHTPSLLGAAAVVQVGIRRLFIGEPLHVASEDARADAPNDARENATGVSPLEFLRSHSIEVLELDHPDCAELTARFARENPDAWQEATGC